MAKHLSTGSKRWLQAVGALYLLNFVMITFVRAPIGSLGPEGALAQAAAGEPMARFLVDTWTLFGLEVGAVGVALLIASRVPEQARVLMWTVIAIEASRGIIADTYMIVRGNDPTVLGIWIVIHTVVIVTGLLCLRGTDSARLDSEPAEGRL
jgi:hypothetical protein